MLDLKAGRDAVASEEPNLDLRRVGPVASEVPKVTEAERRLPDRDLSPVVLDAVRRPLEDPAADAALEDHVRVVFPGRGVIRRPPDPDPRRPDLERIVARAVDVVRQPDRLDHRRPRPEPGVVFEATSVKRAAASPQTRSR
jgi:hypothetical protein